MTTISDQEATAALSDKPTYANRFLVHAMDNNLVRISFIERVNFLAGHKDFHRASIFMDSGLAESLRDYLSATIKSQDQVMSTTTGTKQ